MEKSKVNTEIEFIENRIKEIDLKISKCFVQVVIQKNQINNATKNFKRLDG